LAFRFDFAKVNLDPLSERAVSEFAAKLKSGAFSGKEVVFVGFADSVGRFEQNNRIAASRASSVLKLIEAQLDTATRDSVKLTTAAYGELLPYLCNEDEFGRDANRRVEIWVR
jgi:phosphate transport system substrate-binding protein